MLPTRRRTRSALTAGVLALGLTVSACGGDDDEETGDARPAGPEVAGSVVQYADCGDWRDATREERYATIEALKGHLTPQTEETPRSALDDDRAYEIFQKTCAPGQPSSLRLYKLYVRAQGFAPLAE